MKDAVHSTTINRVPPDETKLTASSLGRLTKHFVLGLMATMFLLAACKRAPQPSPVVLFDQGHDQHFLVENKGDLDLSKLGKVFTDQGFRVKSSSNDQAITGELLSGVSALVISGAFKPFSDHEIGAIRKFLDRGGQLCVMLHIAAPLSTLLNNLGVAISNGVIREQTNLPQPESPTDFFVTDLAPHPLTKGLTRINFYGTWALNTELPANVVARTSPKSWIDLNDNKSLNQGDAIQAFSVVVTGQLGLGHFMVFGDDAIFQNRFLVGPNQRLATNMASWLKVGSYY